MSTHGDLVIRRGPVDFQKPLDRIDAQPLPEELFKTDTDAKEQKDADDPEDATHSDYFVILFHTFYMPPSQQVVLMNPLR
jgi:hypothetical protein